MEQSPEKSIEITEMLREWGAGKQEVLSQLLPLVYAELRAQARRYLRRERAGHTLQATGLIHEVYLKLIDQRAVNLANRQHFFALAANLMRRILIDYARAKQLAKRGGDDNVRLTLETAHELLRRQRKKH